MNKQGLIFNAFVEGLGLIVLGVACSILGTVYKVADVAAMGQPLMFTGMGYIGAKATGK